MPAKKKVMKKRQYKHKGGKGSLLSLVTLLKKAVFWSSSWSRGKKPAKRHDDGNDDRHSSKSQQGLPKNKSGRKPKSECMKFEKEIEEQTIDFVEQNEVLWNPSSPNYCKPDCRDARLADLAQLVLDRYVREHRKKKSGSGTKNLSSRMLWLQTRPLHRGKAGSCPHSQKRTLMQLPCPPPCQRRSQMQP